MPWPGLIVTKARPAFERPLVDEKSIADSKRPIRLAYIYVFDAVAEIKRALDGNVPLLGFAGSPFTLRVLL